MPVFPLPPPNALHLWRLALDLPSAEQTAAQVTLTPVEAARAGRFRFEHDQRHFAAGRGQLRQVLAAYTGQPAAHVPLVTDAHGKPHLASDPALHFNLAHSGVWALLAVTRHGPVGVDIEVRRAELELATIARRFFAPGEAQRLAALPAGEQLPAFFRCWTRKEAYVKARGAGLSLPLDEFEVSLRAAAPRLLSVAGDAAEAERWTLFEPALPEGYAGAVAIRALAVQLEDCGVWAASA